MTAPITIDELPIPASLDAPEADAFRAANELGNLLLVEALGPAAVPDTPAAMLAIAQDQQYERKQLHVARFNGTIVASAFAAWSIAPTTRVTWLGVGVHPAWRRQGIGTAMCDRMEALARAAGRPVVQGWAFHHPTEGPHLESPTGFGAIPREERNARFLLQRGYSLEQVARYSMLPLPVDPATLENNRAAAAAKAGADVAEG